MSTQDNISSQGPNRLTDEQMMAYVEGRLSAEEQRQVEAWLSEEGMESDALEGLQQLKTGDATQLATRINYKLQNDLRRNRRTRRNHFADNKWGWIAVLVILLLAILAFVVIKVAG